jgi:hypothetical protein
MSLRSIRLIPKKTVIIHLSWLGTLLIFILAVIIPFQRFMIGLDAERTDIQYRIEEQNSLLPIYQTLKTKSQATSVTILPTPERGKLSRSMVGTVPSAIRGIAGNASMEAVSVLPDLNALANQSRYLLLHTVVRGDVMNFRKFLIGVGALPYLERIEEIEIRQDPDFTEFRMKIRLAMNQ